MRYFILLCLLFSVNTFSQSTGTPVQMKPEFRLGELDLQIVSSDLFYVKATNSNISYLSQFGSVKISSDQKYLSFDTLQCVAVTQALSYAGPTGNWIRGNSITYSTRLYSPIATFYSNTGVLQRGYGNNKYSHTGILVMHDRQGFFMLEQNWELPPPYDINKPVGRLAVRFIQPSGSYQANAQNYYVINK